MDIQKVGVVNAGINNASFKGDETQSAPVQTEPSDQGGSKFFALASGTAAVALAGLAIYQHKQIKGLNGEIEKLSGKASKNADEVAEAVKGKVKKTKNETSKVEKKASDKTVKKNNHSTIKKNSKTTTEEKTVAKGQNKVSTEDISKWKNANKEFADAEKEYNHAKEYYTAPEIQKAKDNFELKQAVVENLRAEYKIPSQEQLKKAESDLAKAINDNKHAQNLYTDKYKAEAKENLDKKQDLLDNFKKILEQYSV